MTGPVEWRIVATLALLALSAFFSGSESAFFTLLGRGGLANIEQEDAKLGDRIRAMLATPGRLISSIMIGNEIVNIFISVLIAAIFATFLVNRLPFNTKDESFWIQIASTLTSAAVLLVVGEVIPKTIGIRFPRGFSRLIAVPLFWFYKLIFPFEYLFRRFSELFLKALGVKIGRARKFKEQELAELVEAGEEEGILEETEYALLKNVFAFGDLTAAEVMTPRQDVFSLPIEMDYAEFKRKFLESGYSRLPIYQRTPDQIIGIITAKDILKYDATPQPKSLINILRRPYAVPPQKKLDDLLLNFLSKNIHLALVVNEYGEVMGVITLEDLLEEIFGESVEGPVEEELVELGENRWEVAGRMEIRAFNEKMETGLSAPGIKTIAGYLLNEFGRVPAIEDQLEREGYRFRVKEIRRRQIARIEVERVND